ncbi:Uncharacterised protein [Vibrio cholerae]|nr:Uncharacterised protein [Vibrio cholerae]CSI47660.1 Uncharacterised protein [Vibrio cholerae]CSI50666.1 Uncharacterised protein [Vibrio cholerae]
MHKRKNAISIPIKYIVIHVKLPFWLEMFRKLATNRLHAQDRLVITHAQACIARTPSSSS